MGGGASSGGGTLAAAVLLVAAAAGLARADEPAGAGALAPKKIAALGAKAAARPPTSGERAAHDRALRARVGKRPAPVVTVFNLKTREAIVLPLEGKPEEAVSPAVWDRFLRCHFTAEPHAMDLRLAGVLAGAAREFGARRVEIVSGFRAAKFQLVLRKKGREVARDSQHSKGTAVDFRVPGVPTRKLHAWLQSLHLGGVGLYPHSGFVHADTGPVRNWSGY